MNTPALLVLEDGSSFHGQSVGADGLSAGEVVFNTSMTGYQEILTDPSYAGQLVTLTCPHIGNVGANAEDVESDQVFCAGLIVKNVPCRHNNWRSEESLPDYLHRRGVVAISEIDTRKLTRILRDKGAQRGCISAQQYPDEAAALTAARSFPGLAGMDLASVVTTERAYKWSGGAWDLESGYQTTGQSVYSVIAFDFGIKRNIMRLLSMRECGITVVPATATAEEVLSMNPDGVFLSNGPGDPEACDYAINAIRHILDAGIPVFGICLGHQLLCLASGAKTEKMKFGHHGANHPVQDMDSGQVLITSQNHGFTVEPESLGDHIRVTHRSLFDNTIQGIERLDVPAFSFQGHPEASPGPKDINHLFDRFIRMMETHQSRKTHA